MAVAPRGTALIISTPPAMATSYWPETSPAAAKWMDCWDEPHWRSTVVPGTDSGQPAASTAIRPTLPRLLADLLDAAPDHVVDHGGVEAVPRHQRVQHVGREVHGVELGE